MKLTASEADEISRLAELLAQGNRCHSCGTCERCYAIWAPRPVTIEEYTRRVLGERTKGESGEADHADGS